jgi:hypothetical protein
MKKIVNLLVITTVLFVTACNFFNSYGKKITISDKVEVYIKGDSVTEEAGKKLGTYLDTTWKELDNKRSFQLTKENGVYLVHMVIDEKALKDDPTLDVSFMALRLLIAMNVFPEAKVNLVLTDNQFKPFKTYKEETSTEPVEPAVSDTAK